MSDRGGPRGRGNATRGRGRGRGGGGGFATPGAQAPLAVQMRQLERATEAPEVGIIRRYRGLVVQVRSTYGAAGLLFQEVAVREADDSLRWCSLLDADDLLRRRDAGELRARREGRRASRLPADRQQVAVNDLTAEEIRLLDLSQAAWDRFRAREGPGPAQEQVRQA